MLWRHQKLVYTFKLDKTVLRICHRKCKIKKSQCQHQPRLPRSNISNFIFHKGIVDAIYSCRPHSCTLYLTMTVFGRSCVPKPALNGMYRQDRKIRPLSLLLARYLPQNLTFTLLNQDGTVLFEKRRDWDFFHNTQRFFARFFFKFMKYCEYFYFRFLYLQIYRLGSNFKL